LSASMALFEQVLGVYSAERMDKLHKAPIILVGCYVFVIIVAVYLLNVLLAQLICSYAAVYQDIIGFARLKRIKVIGETMPRVSLRRWQKFTETLKFDKPLDFNEGDVGLPNGICVQEDASDHATTQDTIKRFGGSTSLLIPWPDEDAGKSQGDKFSRLEQLVQKGLEKSKAADKAIAASKSTASAASQESGTPSGREVKI